MREPFVFSSFGSVPEAFLQGYCFVGADLVFGDHGYAEFRAKRSAVITPGLDGSYVVLNTAHGETRVGTDFTGYTKVFYYSSDTCWAISDSLLALAEHLKSKGVAVRIDQHQLSSWFIKTAFGNQLVSFKTSVEGIRLLPTDRQIVIRHERLSIERRNELDGEKPATYKEALEAHIQAWTARLSTVVTRGELQIRSDLSGGKDSRTNLGLLLASGVEWRSKVHFFSSKPRAADFRVASLLAKLYGFKLNKGPWEPRHQSAKDALRQWKYDCLGIYGPVYFPHTILSPRHILLYGSGGESHRQFYPVGDPADFLEQHRSQIPSQSLFDGMKRDVLEDLETLRSTAAADVDPMILHYRNFRDRCHGGRATRNFLIMAPLSGSHLAHATSMCSGERLLSGQVMVDLLFNLDSTLALLPYDSASKSPSMECLEELTRTRQDKKPRVAPGEIFGLTAQESHGPRFDQREAMRLMMEDFQANLPRAKALGFFPSAYLQQASEEMKASLGAGGFAHAVKALGPVHVILAGELARLG